ncbi:hypothetical protein M885DRAFT_591648 [Pelagophyceae sp. CCMP2097]|nr:hypothetical protein M885DRAFT_591648 [Pelagophyceae sp. CCMP2097]
MSLFLDFPCSLVGEAKVTTLAWCQVEPICAVVTAGDHRVSFYLEEGVCLEACSVSRKCDATQLCWQSKSKTLAVGWEDGHVSVYALSSTPSTDGGPSEPRLSTVFSSDAARGRSPVRVCLWNPSQTRLVTGDAAGAVVVWKASARGALSPLKELNVASGVTCAVFSTLASGAQKPEALAHAFSPAFFLGTRGGGVFYADDLGHCAEVAALGSHVDHLLFYEQRDRLVVLTRALTLVQLQIGGDGRVRTVMQMKVAVVGGAADRGIKSVCWAGPGVIAAATGEALVRVWNLANDEAYVVALKAPGAAAATGGKKSRFAGGASSVAFNPLQRYLAAGTKDGRIFMWRFVGGYTGADGNEGQDKDVQTSAADWEAMPPTSACGGASAVDVLAWGPGHGLVAAAAPDGALSLLSETVLHRLLSGDVGAIQLSTDAVRLERQNGCSALLRTRISIRAMAVSSRHVVVANGHERDRRGSQISKWCHVYKWTEEMRDEEPERVCDFASPARVLQLREETLLRAAPLSACVELCNLQGVVRQKISFSEGEGTPTHLDVNGRFLAVATTKGLIKIFQVDRREPKQLGSPGKFDLWADAASAADAAPAFGARSAAAPAEKQAGHAIRSIRCNADGARVSILADRVHGSAVRIREPDSRLYVYDSERDVVDSHDFGDRGRVAVSHFWDAREPKLLACETRAARPAAGDGDKADTRTAAAGLEQQAYSSLGLRHSPDGAGEPRSAVVRSASARTAVFDDAGPKVEVATLFVTADFGVLLQDVFALEAPLEALLGVQVPRLFFTRRGAAARDDGGIDAQIDQALGATAGNFGAEAADGDVGLASRVMRDFVGLGDVDDEAKAALLAFSFYLTVGNMDEAHRAVRLIQSPSVWENMAHICVKTKRLDVAEVCLGHMGHARGAAAVRAAKAGAPELEARVAAVAIQLGLRNDAARLYRECGRFDLLNALYQAAGEWDLALQTAATHDRIHLRATHHRYARHLEALGDIDASAAHYELADTHRREVPRMLVARNEQAALERYVMNHDDPALLKWWAGYCESLGHAGAARHCYESAKDSYNLVRVACLGGDVRRAADIVHDSRSAAAAYHLARHLESKGDVHEAIQYFAKSGCFNHAIRLAREYSLDADLLQFAIQARPSLQVEVAAYFERKGEFEKAVQLYQKGGELAKALDLCFKVGGAGRAQMFEVLGSISADVDSNASPAVLARCAEFFIEHGQHEDAVRLYIAGGRFAQAIALCVDRRVTITEALAEQLTPVKADGDAKGGDAGAGKRALSADERNDVLNELARACKKQGAFQLACKKYTQAGDRSKALKCLLKSGDTKNIIYYASVSRHRDIYILAANYLQSLDWQSGSDAAAELTKKIVEFYTKARAHEQLAAFYDAYAQMEIDEYRDYEKAVGALRQSRAQLDKARKAVDCDKRLAALDSRISTVDDFVEARSYEKTDARRMADMCSALLQKHDVDAAIRVGDAFALLVSFCRSRYHFKVGNAHDAFDLVQQMRARRIVLHPYIEHDLLSQIHAAVGVAMPADEKADAPDDIPDDDAHIDDDIPDDAVHDDDDDDRDSHK